MQSQSDHWAVVATTADERGCAELELVLTACGIQSQKMFGIEGWRLLVAAADAERAVAQLVAYRAENARAIGQRRLEEIGNGWPGVGVYIVILLAVFVCVRQSAFSLDWYGAGRLQAGKVMMGEGWRAVTALTVHLDFDHLAGNLGFGAFFGYFAGRYLGPGVAWLAILSAGTLGNVLNAVLQSPEHRSIGASTAVFAALGVLTAYTWRRGFLKETPWRARIAPIIAGVGLLAFTGTGGENTDVFAHLAGFVMGFVTGLLLARFARVEITQQAKVQKLSGALALFAVSAAWVWGLLTVG